MAFMRGSCHQISIHEYIPFAIKMQDALVAAVQERNHYFIVGSHETPVLYSNYFYFLV